MYQYPIENCDVNDKERLAEFRDKRAEWIGWLSGDDRHAVSPQIAQLLWNHVLFCTVNDLRKHAADNPSESVGFNPAILRLFDAGFVSTQATTIRRLTDRQPWDSSKGVISLRRLITDIRDNRELMTREIYVSYDGLPYDPEPVRTEALAEDVSQGVSFAWLPTTGPEAWCTSEMLHANFDKLMKRNIEQRNRGDVMSSDWFDWLDELLDVCTDIRKYTDKFIAHAAEPASRKELTPEQVGITLNRLEVAQRAICRVANFIVGPLLWESGGSIFPIPQDDHLVNLDKGWVPKSQPDLAHEYWDNNLAVIESWEDEPLWPSSSDETLPSEEEEA